MMTAAMPAPVVRRRNEESFADREERRKKWQSRVENLVRTIEAFRREIEGDVSFTMEFQGNSGDKTVKLVRQAFSTTHQPLTELINIQLALEEPH